MIPRYTRPVMEKIWNERNEWQTMLNVEIAACEANAELGRIPKEAVEVIKAKADFDVDRIHEIDREINHDIIAFLTNVGEHVGDEAKYIHMGLTSTDVKDTGLNVQLKQASAVLLDDLQKLADVLKRRAVEFKHTPTIGRTHGVHAEPTTFGLKLLLWYSETLRNIDRMIPQTFKITDRMKELGGLFGLLRCQIMHIELHQIGSQFVFVFVDQIFLFLNFVELII